MIERLAMAESLFSLRNQQSVTYKVDEKALADLQEFQDENRSFVPDAFAHELLPLRFQPLEEVEEPPVPEEVVDPDKHSHVLQEAIRRLESGETHVSSPEEELAEKAFGVGTEDFFGGSNMDLSGETTKIAEAIMDARRKGYGNLDVEQQGEFFRKDEEWWAKGPDGQQKGDT